MVDTKDIVLGIIGISVSIYGGQLKDLLVVVSGILILILTIWLNLREQEEDINILKAQINTQRELNKISIRMDAFENEINKIKKR